MGLLDQLMPMLQGGMMGATQQPAAGMQGTAQQQGNLAPFYDPTALAQLQTDQLAYQRKAQLAQQLMQTGYTPNSGKFGVFAGIASMLGGKLAQDQNDSKLSDIVKRAIEAQSQAAAAQHAQQRDDEAYKTNEEIRKDAASKQAGLQYAPMSYAANLGGFDPRTGQVSIDPKIQAVDIATKQAEAENAAKIAAANRQGPADPFADIKAALAQGVITPDQARQAMAKKVTGDVGGLSPKDQQAIDKRLPVLQDQTNKIDTALDIANKMKGQMGAGGYDVGGLSGLRNAYAPSYFQSTGGQELGTDAGNLILAAQSALQGTGSRGSVAQLKILEKSKPNAQMDATANQNSIDEIIKTLSKAREAPAAELEHYGNGGTPTTWAQKAAQMSAQPPAAGQPASGGKTVVRTGTDAQGNRVAQFSDGTIGPAP